MGVVFSHGSYCEGEWVNMIKFHRHTRANYWSCTKLADFIRGTKKPLAVTLDEWDMWRDDAKAAYSFRYWVAEKMLNRIQDLWLFPVDAWYSIHVYFSNRFRTQTHVLPTGLSVGQWHEFDKRMLHGLFNTFVIFVEREQPQWIVDSKKSPAESAIEYLLWASNLKYGDGDFITDDHELYGKPTSQAISAKWQLAAYEWWKYQRPHRPDLWMNDDLTYEQRDEIEKQRSDEDEKWMIELIQHRHELWS